MDDDDDRNDPFEAQTGGRDSYLMSLFAFRRGAPKPPSARRRRMALFLSYLPDWILTIVLAVVFFSLDKVPGFKREFSIDDPSLRFPFATHERVPSVALYMLAVVAPFVLQIIVNLLTIRSRWDFHSSTLGLLLSLVLAGAITQFTKITVGRPRPDVISRCQPDANVTNPPYGLVSVAICHQIDSGILNDGWRSFPSGHSSLSFAGLGFLAFYLAGKLHLFDEKGHTVKAWISLVPLSGAALVAISRTMDYRHHWQDVIVGSALGLATSYFAYRQYYPSLNLPVSHQPYAPRTLGHSGDNHEFVGQDVDTASGAPILPTVRPGARQRPALGGGRVASEAGTEYSRHHDEEMGSAALAPVPALRRGESDDGQVEMDRRIVTPNLKG